MDKNYEIKGGHQHFFSAYRWLSLVTNCNMVIVKISVFFV